MPDTTLPHPQGSVCWLDTLLNAQDQLLNFYQPLLGWSGEADPADPNRYAVQTIAGGKAVAGVGSMPPSEMVMPWTGYFAVDDVDATAAKVAQLGGTLIVSPMDAGGLGRFAHATDPGGAAFGLWQPGTFAGFQAYGEPGCLGWLELVTTEGRSSAEFYGALLGTEVEAMKEMPDSYWTLNVGGEPRAGIFRVDEVEKNHWRPYFVVADADTSVATAVAAGARITDPLMDTPFGRMAGLIDPIGLEFRLNTMPEGM